MGLSSTIEGFARGAWAQALLRFDVAGLRPASDAATPERFAP
jgi:hypothetical protein